MVESKKCSLCGAELPPGAPGGHCPQCLIKFAITPNEGAGNPGSGSAGGPIAEDVLANEKPGDRIGRYELLEQIGEGGMGAVWMAEQQEPVRRKVALKVVKLGMDTRQVVARFEAERQALALMDHPNIAKVFDAGATKTGRPYFVMELVKGARITDYCDGHQLDLPGRLGLLIQVCCAVQHAHQKGIIHRDLKPSNILVTEEDGIPIPKIIDFGIAKATTGIRLTDKTLFTAFEQFLGTPAYMSPEQAGLGQLDVDTRSDIYSLGVLLYELLTGRAPFDSEELQRSALGAILQTIREKDPPRPSARLTMLTRQELTIIAFRRETEASRLPRLLSGDLDWIVMKALDKDRDHRYGTANGLARDLERHLANEPVTAQPPGNFYRLTKMVRRNRIAFITAGIVVAALIFGLGIALWSLQKERQARQRADVEAQKSRQVAQFLQNTLQGVGPSVALGRDTTLLHEILDRTVKQIDTLTNQPEVQAQLLSVSGGVYEDLDDSQQAEPLLRRALVLRRQILGERNAEVANSLVQLARTLRSLEQFSQAETLAREALTIRQQLFGTEDPQVADALNNLAAALTDEAKLPEAEQTARRALAMSRKIRGEQDPLTANSLAELSLALEAEGQLIEAETLRREALTIYQQQSESLNSDYVMADLAALFRNERKFDQAKHFYSQHIALDRKLFGDPSYEVLADLERAARTSEIEGAFPEAETGYRETIATGRMLKPTEDVKLFICYGIKGLGRTQLKEGKLAQAESLFREAIFTNSAALSSGMVLTNFVYYFASTLTREGKFLEAERVLTGGLTNSEIGLSREDFLMLRGELRASAGRWPEAAADFSSALKLDPGNWRIINRLAPLLARTGKVDDYRALCRTIADVAGPPSSTTNRSQLSLDCLILPHSGADMQAVSNMTEITIISETNYQRRIADPVSRALFEYRSGDFVSAAKRASETIAAAKAVSLPAKDYFILAMARQRLGQTNEAKAAFAKGLAAIQKKPQKSANGEALDFWMDQITGEILMAEAASVLENNY